MKDAMKSYVCPTLVSLSLALCAIAAPVDPLEKSFVTTPPDAGADTMWMWMNGRQDSQRPPYQSQKTSRNPRL